jgi:hypothetical protein
MESFFADVKKKLNKRKSSEDREEEKVVHIFKT